MLIESLEVYNLFSYSDKQKISFSPATSLVVGPNNSGKTNILRILKLLIETLMRYPAPSLSPYVIFSDEANPFLNIKLNLSRKETWAIISFLSFYRGTGDYEYFNYNNWNILDELLNTICIKVSWEQVNISSQQSMRSRISFVFEKIGLSIIEKDDFTLQFEVDGHAFRPSLPFLGLLGKIRFPEEFLRDFESINIESMAHVITMDRLFDASNITDNNKLQALKNISYFARGHHYSMTDITFAHLIELILRGSIYFTNRKGISFLRGTLALTNSLSEDGSNLSSFLYSLKMSSDLHGRIRYTDIQKKFEEIFRQQDLSFDLVSSYDEDDSSNQNQNKGPKSVSICITQGKTKQFFLDDVGAGLGEVIYLLTLSFGLRESVVLLDEPALNLHQPLLKSLISKIITSNSVSKDDSNQSKNAANDDSDNQFIIITHSPELTDYLLFEADARMFYITKISDGKSEINSLDKETENWITERKSQLSYLVDTRLFFGRALILMEGDSDRFLLIGVTKYFASVDSELDLDSKEIMTISVGSKDNFPKYKKLVDAFKIPCVFIGDKGIEIERGNKEIFKSCAYITKDGIEGDNPNIFVIKEGNLEDFMNQIDTKLYSNIEDNVKREYNSRDPPKPVVAYRFAEKVSENPGALKAIRELLTKVLLFVANYRKGIDTSQTTVTS